MNKQIRALFSATVFILLTGLLTAQNNVGIGTATPSPSSVLDVTAIDKGVLIPRLTTLQRTGIAAPANGLMVYDTDLNCFCYYNSLQWITLCSAGGASSINSLTWACNASTGDTGTLSLNTATANYTAALPVWHLGGANATPNDYLGTANNADIQIATNNANCTFDPQKQKMIITKSGNVGIGSFNGTTPTLPQNKLLVQTGKIVDKYNFLYTNVQLTPNNIGILSQGGNDSATAVNAAIVGLSDNNHVRGNIGTMGLALGTGTNFNIGLSGFAVGDSTQNTGVSASALGNDARNTAVDATASGISDANIGVSGIAKDSRFINFGVLGSANDSLNPTIQNVGVQGNSAFATMTNSGVRGFSSNGPENRGVEGWANQDNTINTGVYALTHGMGSSTMNSGVTTWVDGANNNTFSTNGCYNCNHYNAGVIGQVRGDNSVNVGTFGTILPFNGAGNANSDCIGAIGSVRLQGIKSAIGVLGEVLDYFSTSFNYGVLGRQPGSIPPTSPNIAPCFPCPVSYAGYFEGDVFCAATYYYSDPKLKTNVHDYSGAVAQLRQLNIKQYSFKTEEFPYLNMPQGEQVGVLSTEMKLVFPNLVKHSISPGIGNDRKDLDFEAVNYNALIPVLVQAVKELDSKTGTAETIAELKTANAELKKSIADLQRQMDAIKQKQ